VFSGDLEWNFEVWFEENELRVLHGDCIGWCMVSMVLRFVLYPREESRGFWERFRAGNFHLEC